MEVSVIKLAFVDHSNTSLVCRPAMVVGLLWNIRYVQPIDKSYRYWIMFFFVTLKMSHAI